MKGRKLLLCVIIAVLMIVNSVSVFAVGESTSSEVTADSFSLTLECKVDGKVPKDTTFTFSVTQYDYFEGESDNPQKKGDFIIKTSENTDGKKVLSFPNEAFQGGYRYEIKLISTSNKLVTINATEVNVYFSESAVKADAMLGHQHIAEFVDEPAVFTFDCTAKSAVTISTKDCVPIKKVYDGKTDATIKDENFKLVGIVDGHDVKLKIKKSQFNTADVKTANKVTASELTLTGKDADKYGLAIESFEVDGVITPRPITVTADKLVMTEGSEEPKLTYTLSEELIEGNKIKGDLARASGNTFGEYAITRGTLSFGDNYEITFIDGVLTISGYSLAEVIDNTTTVKISGYFDPTSTIKVSALDPASDVYSILASSTSWGKVVSAYDIIFSSKVFDGDLTVSIPVDAKYNGKSFAIYQQLSNDAVACYKTTAQNGFVSVKVSECTQFMLVTDKDIDENSEGSVSFIKVLIIILSVIIGLGLVIALFFFGMVFFNKTEQLKRIIRTVKKIFKK